MKETVNVNIGSQAFTLDEDAYRVLRNYLEDIRSRLPEYDTETMGDIEARIAEIFREIVSSPMRVITLDTVRQTMDDVDPDRKAAEEYEDQCCYAYERYVETEEFGQSAADTCDDAVGSAQQSLGVVRCHGFIGFCCEC